MHIRVTGMRFSALAACTFLLVGAARAQSGEDGASDLRISGFGTLGVVHADAPAGWKYRRDLSQSPSSGDTSASVDSRLGVQLNYAPSSRLEFVGQLVAARRSRYTANASAIEWAFAAYRPAENLTVRLGRLNVDAYLLSDYRNVGFAYSFVRPPVDVYGLLPTSFDGGDVTQSWTSGGASWRAKAYLGRTFTGDLAAGPATDVSPVLGFVLSRSADGLLLRASLSQARVEAAVEALRPLIDGLGALSALPVPEIAAQAAALRSRIDLEGAVVRYASLGTSYDVDEWQFSAEYTRVFGHPVVSLSARHLGIVRRFGAWSVFGGSGAVASRGDAVQAPAWADILAPVVGPQRAQQAQALGSGAAYAANRSGSRQRTLSLGARWDVHPQVALKAQWDDVRIDRNGSALWTDGTLDAGRAHIVSVTVDFVY